MPAHFAGSASVSDRRRRRLAREIEWKQSVPTSTKPARSSRNSSVSEEESVNAAPADVQSRRWSLIPLDRRLLAIVCALNVLCWIAVLWLGISDWAEQRGLKQLTTLDGGTTLRFFSVVQILATSQLCFLIYWYRSRSRKDFMGRYRIWSWAGLFWGVVCICLATNVQFTFVRSMLERFDLDAWRPDTLSWLFPLSIGMIALYRVLRREMRLSRPSIIAWEVSFCLAVVSALLAMGLENLFPESIRNTINVSVWSLWHVSLTITCLIHARHVVHVSNEAPPRLPSRGTKLLRWSYRRLIVVGERVLSVRLLKRSAAIDEVATSDSKEKTKRSRRDKEETGGNVPSTSVEADAKPSRRRKPAEDANQSADTPTPKKAFFGVALMTAGAAKTKAAISGIKNKGAALTARFSFRKTSDLTGIEETASSAAPTAELTKSTEDNSTVKTPSKGLFSFFKKGEQKPAAEGDASNAALVAKSVVAEAPKKEPAKPKAEDAAPEKTQSKGLFSFFKKREQKPVAEGDTAKAVPVAKPVVAEAPKKEAAKPKVEEAAPEKAPSKGMFSFLKKGEQKTVTEGDESKAAPVAKPVVAEAPKKEAAKPKVEEATPEKAPSKGMFSFLKKGEQNLRVDAEPQADSAVPVPHVTVASKPEKPAPPPAPPKATSEPPPPAPVKSPTPVSLPKEDVQEQSESAVATRVKASDRREIPESDYSSNYEYDDMEPSYEDDDEDMSRMSSKQRKKLKKQRRQQSRSQDDY